MVWMVTGSTGALGQALMAALKAADQPTLGVARTGGDRNLDLTDRDKLYAVLKEVQPTVIINTAAVTDLAMCEGQPDLAYAVNAEAVRTMADWSGEAGTKLVQISTDHFFTGDRDRPHDEDAPVVLLNTYAATKHAGEEAALKAPDALVIRTNFTGPRGRPDQPTFAEWALDAIRRRRPMALFHDYFTSTLDSGSCARAIIDLVAAEARGRINVASSQVASKRDFVRALGNALDTPVDWAETASVRTKTPPRAESCGLDVRRAEALLGRPLPDLTETCNRLVAAMSPEPAEPVKESS